MQITRASKTSALSLHQGIKWPLRGERSYLRQEAQGHKGADLQEYIGRLRILVLLTVGAGVPLGIAKLPVRGHQPLQGESVRPTQLGLRCRLRLRAVNDCLDTV